MKYQLNPRSALINYNFFIMNNLLLKHKIDRSFLKYGFVISKEDLNHNRELVLNAYNKNHTITIIFKGSKFNAVIDHGNRTNPNYYRLMFKTALINYIQEEFLFAYEIKGGNIYINKGVNITIGFYTTNQEYVWEMREINKKPPVSITEMKKRYQEFLNLQEQKYTGYANALDRDFVTRKVNELFGKSSAYLITSSEEILSLVESIRNDPETNELDKKIGSRRSSCSLKVYAQFLESLNKENSETNANKNHNFDLNAIITSISNTGLIFEASFVKRFVCSLLTKPFVILSGLTGSGKTQLAITFAKLICESESQYEVIPVGADWTNRDRILGYPNALEESKYHKPENKALQLIIEASIHQDKPYFLILDEMNMSYVERYFADFLSAMESGENIPLWEKGNDDVPSSIELTKNLFIVGTINVDETTYMFSPKVLDRANVLEFRIKKEQMRQYLTGFKKASSSEKVSKMAADFVKIATEKSHGELSEEMVNTLIDMFDTLGKIQKEFGYRTANEMSQFIRITKEYTDMEDNDAIDAAIVQKLLPKVHGSRKKVSPVLKALWLMCYSSETTETAEIDTLEQMPKLSTFKYPLTAEKIWRMFVIAQDNGFTSFAEA